MRLFLYIIAMCICGSFALYTDTVSLENLYINPENQKHSEALIIYNSANPCENCAKAKEQTYTLLQQYYADILTIYNIDLSVHPEFAAAFKINAPLTLVIIRISDGAAFGYEKLTELPDLVNNIPLFKRRIKEFIDNFLN